MGDVIIPPWVRPESPETLRWIDDATTAFPPAFGRGTMQRGIWADPRWGLRRRYRGLRSDQKAAILSAINESRGQSGVIRVTPHAPLRGSFSTGELVTNNTFESGATGFQAFGSTNPTLSASDRVMRATIGDGIANAGVGFRTTSGVSVTAYAPYVVRALIRAGRSLATSYGNYGVVLGASAGGTEYLLNLDAVRSASQLVAAATVPYGTTVYPGFIAIAAANNTCGDWIEVPYVSLARCALVDNGQNMLLQSDDFTNSSWTKTAATATANLATAPNGTLTGDTLTESATTASHYAVQNVTVSSATADYCFAIAMRAEERTWGWVQLTESAASHVTTIWFNLSTGAVGTISTTGANWSDVRAFIAPAGNGWYYCAVVARKTSSATVVQTYAGLTTGNGVTNYAGNGTSRISLWRATLAQSSVPVRLSQTTSTSTTGSAQTGGGLHTKGWPAGTSGLLLSGDWFEINGELKQVTAPVVSDAAGLAYIQFRPSLADSPSEADPIIVHEPFGRFIYPAGTKELENMFGIYADCEMNLEEVYV